MGLIRSNDLNNSAVKQLFNIERSKRTLAYRLLQIYLNLVGIAARTRFVCQGNAKVGPVLKNSF